MPEQQPRRVPQQEPKQDSTNLVWIDLEMTGLDPDRHVIIEVASLITNGDLEVLAEGPVIAVHRADEELTLMDAWNTKTHRESGLTERVRQSTIDVAEAERQTLDFVRQWVPRALVPLAGNTIGQDRRFLRREMPSLEAYLHYRNVDVSTIKELARRWYPAQLQGPEKRQAHRALDDIRESVEELRWYRQHLFVAPPPPEPAAAEPAAEAPGQASDPQD